MKFIGVLAELRDPETGQSALSRDLYQANRFRNKNKPANRLRRKGKVVLPLKDIL